MSKKSKNEISHEDDHKERMIREIMSKEILKKIERRVENNNEQVIKTVRQMLEKDK